MKLKLDSVLLERMEKWLETIVITAALLLVGYFFNSSDPFFMHADFPWVWFAPLLIALRYGIAPGMFSVSIIFMLFLVMQRQGGVAGDFPTNFMLGGVLIALVCGQFSTIWNTRLRRSDSLSLHAGERFEQLSRAYFMVRLSHDRLEQNLISRPLTLRDAMFDLRKILASHGGQLDKETGSALISILVHYCSLESAAIFIVDRNGQLNDKPVAESGKGVVYLADDLLLRSAIESGNTSYQSINSLTCDENSPYLVAAPLRTSSGVLKGVLLVSEMPFLALHHETLQILGVLLAYASDHAEAAYEARTLLAAFPDCPSMFASELVKMIRLRRDLEVSSALVIINVQQTSRLHDICISLERQQRGLDHGWQRDLEWGVQFVTLMPFSGLAAVEGYITRINNVLLRDFNMRIGNDGLTSRSFVVSAEEPLNQLAELLADVR